MTKFFYIILSYVIIGTVGIYGVNKIRQLNTQVKLQRLEIESMKESQARLIDSFNQEIQEIQEKSKERAVTVKEIVKVVKGTDDEKCINSAIPKPVLDRVRNKGNNKK